MRRISVWFVVLSLALGLAPTCFAAAPAPSGTVVLTVTGEIALTNSDAGLEFDMAMLEGLGLIEYEVRDPWLGKKVYAGVPINTILEYAGALDTATLLTVVAKDGKEVSLEVAEAEGLPIMLATRDAGKAIGGGLGGPVKLVFPYDTHPEVQATHPKDDWSWFVVRLEVGAQQ